MNLLDYAIFGDPKKILLALSGRHYLPELLPLATQLLGTDQRIALTQIWLVRETDPRDCNSCPLETKCSRPGSCLHLMSSFGKSLVESSHPAKPAYELRRFPLGFKSLGRIVNQGEIVRIQKPSAEIESFHDSLHVFKEGVEHFVGLPLKYHHEMLGVLAIFAREPIGDSCDQWLQMIADHLAAAISNARALERIELLKQQLEQENAYLRDEVSQIAYGELVGNSPALQTVIRQIDLVAPTDASVLILGESGTGKELVAREVHQRSQRRDKPLIKVNCAAIPRELYESEFFGHSKGSFTGALRDRVGRFELADGGTLFLDEIGETPLDLQSKLLRVLQEGELERVGEDRTRRVDVRVIAATNRRLREESAAGRFRQDLYYRLSVFPIELPPLRDRIDDIPVLARHFLEKLSRQLGRTKLKLTQANVHQLLAYSWPGNIRELQHILERAAILATDNKIRLDFPQTDHKVPPIAVPARRTGDGTKLLTAEEIKKIERENICKALSATQGKIYGSNGAAELLGMKPTTLSSRIRALGIRANSR